MISVPVVFAASPLNLRFDLRVGKAMVAIFWSYMGWEAATHLSEEFKSPSDFYKSILISISVVGVLYLLRSVCGCGKR